MIAAALAITGAQPATAAQAPGHDVVAWSQGWSWTYDTTFRYQDPGTADVTLEERVTYTVADANATFQGEPAYRLSISGTITGGGGNATVDGYGNVGLDDFSGTVSGTRFVRRSDQALLQEHQEQHLNATANVLFGIGVDADVELTLTPEPGWRTHAFPLNPGDSWDNDVDVRYDGGFSYSSSVASGSSPFNGTFNFDGPSTVAAETISVPIGGVATDRITAQSSDGSRDRHWWSPTHKNDARQILELPLDGADLTIDRRLRSANIPTPATTITENVTPSLSCAGGQVTVSGRLSNNAVGTPVNVTLDKSPLVPGQKVSTTTTTTNGGNYSATLTAPSENDGLGKNGSRANWGILVTAGSATNVATLVVTPQNCSTIEYTGAAGAPRDGSATVSATLTDLGGQGRAAGKVVTFSLEDGGSVNATTNAAGVATATLPVNGPVRDAEVTARYAGSTALAAASDTEPFAVGKIATTTSVVANPDPVTVGDPVTFTATVAATAGTEEPPGAVQFTVNGSGFGAPVELIDGSATSAPLGGLGLGEHRVEATYVGSSEFAASTSPERTFRVRPQPLPTTTTSSVTPGAAVFGEPVTLSAEVAANDGGTPTGAVTFRDGDGVVATVPLDEGVASTEVSDLGVGSHAIIAAYSGDDVYAESSAAPRTVTVTKATAVVALQASDTTTVSGEAVTYTAQVGPAAPSTAAPTGTVQLRIDGADVGDPVELSGGQAAFPPVTSLRAGDHAVTVVYSGSAGFEDGTESLTQQVAQADTATGLVISPSPANEGQEVTFTAHVAAQAPGSGAPSGLVTFTAGDETIGAVPLETTEDGAVATLVLTDLAPGSRSVVASYAGDDGYRASASDPQSHTVIEGAAIVSTTTVLTSSKNPSTYGELIRFTADVDAADGSAPVGSVVFSVDGTELAPAPVDADGIAHSPTLGSPVPGSHTVIAQFVPAAGYSGGGDILTQTVATAEVDLSVESSQPDSTYGDPVRFTATVAPRPTGTLPATGFVQFSVAGQPLGDAVPVEGGTATSTPVSDLRPGSHLVTAVYSGDPQYSPTTREITQRVELVSTTTALEVSDDSVTFGDPVTLTATVTPGQDALGAPTGTVRFVDGDATLATVPVTVGPGTTGVASATLETLPAGPHSIRAVYSGSPDFEASSSEPVSVAVAQQTTSIEAEPAVVRLFPLGLPLGQLRITLSAGSEPLAGAPVEFRVGSTTVCTTTTDGSGRASCNAASHLLGLVLSGGYTASYAGDANHQPASARGVILK